MTDHIPHQRFGGEPVPRPEPLVPAIEFDACSIFFGARPRKALLMADQGLDRAEIKAATGNVLGVHDCTLTVGQGEIVVLMGLSGSGKSTLLRAVNGLNPVTRGDVRVAMGDRMVSVPSADRTTLRSLRLNHVSMVFQQFGLLPWRSVAQNVGLGLELAGVEPVRARARIARQLEMVGLSEWAERRVGELSGGMQQRVGLARAFATEAPILLMDEPFSALDPLIRTRLQDELLALQQQNRRTILFVSHDLDEAFRIGNRIALMEGGRLVQIGTSREILTRPANDHVRAFVGQTNLLAVLRAADLAEPGRADGAAVPRDAPAREVLARLSHCDALPLVGGGRVTRTGVMAALAG